MSLFIIIFLSLYALLHGVFLWGIFPLLRGRRWLAFLCGLWLILMITAPVTVRLLEKKGLHAAAELTAWVGYTWMAVVFLGFSIFLVLGVWELAALVVRYFSSAKLRLSLRGKKCSSVVLIIIFAACIWGFYEAHNIRIERVVLHTDKLPADDRPIIIAQVSDVHLGLIRRDKLLRKLVEDIKSINPHILVCTGDMVDAQVDRLDGLSQMWNELEPPLGKFAVTGNHEYYAGLKSSVEFMRESGFEVLRGSGREIGENLYIAGVDDPTGGDSADEMALLGNAAKSRYVILLKHRPEVDQMAEGLFDLQLSGHSHRGQIFPFTLLTAIEYPMQNGLYELENSSFLYTSRGTGTWGPPMRIFSPPEITVFEISPAK